jgi:hypothetical protein
MDIKEIRLLIRDREDLEYKICDSLCDEIEKLQNRIYQLENKAKYADDIPIG